MQQDASKDENIYELANVWDSCSTIVILCAEALGSAPL
jgi:hypothetical protein